MKAASDRRLRFLGVGETCDLGSLYLALQREGHEVRIAVSEPLASGTLAGLVERVEDWQAALSWLKEGPDLGIVLFESVSEGFGAMQDALRRDGHHVVGGSAFGDRLENDRAFAQGLLAELGFPRGHVWRFEDAGAADRFIAENPGRYVLKFSGPGFSSHDNYLGQLADGADVRAMLAGAEPGAAFILMRFIEGVEIGVGAYFDGTRFLEPACLDFEHKRFFTGDLGELTGEMGTLVTYERTGEFFRRTLKLIEPHLRGRRHIGYVNLNTIVNDDGIWPLEFTCRFGYPGYAILHPLQRTGWGEIFAAMIEGNRPRFETESGFCTGVVLTTPPFPYTREEVAAPVGLPVVLPEDFDAEHHHFGEMGQDARGRLVTSGLYGWTMVVTGAAATIEASKQAAYDRLKRIAVPNMRYRLDISDRQSAHEWREIERLGLLDP
jgi:phosphoribosylamine---glycine ligase